MRAGLHQGRLFGVYLLFTPQDPVQRIGVFLRLEGVQHGGAGFGCLYRPAHRRHLLHQLSEILGQRRAGDLFHHGGLRRRAGLGDHIHREIPVAQHVDDIIGGVGSLLAVDDLNELHQRHGVEEMHADDRTVKAIADLCDGQRGCICSKNAAEIYGLEILEKNINFTAKNTTKFIIISNKMLMTYNLFAISDPSFHF